MRKDRKQKDKLKKSTEGGSRKQLANVRVVQRNLIYITNLSLKEAKEDVS
jgi:CCR4-NOT transcription complex subunit 4